MGRARKRPREDALALDHANAVKDGLALLPHPALPEGYAARYAAAEELGEALRGFTLALVEANVRRYYEACPAMGGWDETAMKEELFDPLARFLIIFHGDTPVAFANFRFDMDYGRRVVYCYQLQVEEAQQGKGFGQWLMHRLHALGRALQMERCVLTVFLANARALRFYTAVLGYATDRTSPPPAVGYRILSVDLTTPPEPPP
eukprot:EG_transcript_23884